ncbi:MAG: phosphoribosyltransferase family protein [Candidatus Diapherotrites archaeon]|nr:phosphoribosyltransferase family protein [Candidatus Diapherotrites archaeon]
MRKFQLFKSRRMTRVHVAVTNASTNQLVYSDVERRQKRSMPKSLKGIERRKPSFLFRTKRKPINVRAVGVVETEKLKHELVEKIKRSGQQFTSVVAISRGGLAAGQELADALGLPLVIIGYKSYETGKTYRLKGKRPPISFAVKGKLGSTPLLVDDLTEHGDTLVNTKEVLLKKRGVKKVRTAALFIKDHTPQNRRPDFFVRQTRDWLVFPWEKREFEKLLNAPKPQKVIFRK